MTRPYINKKDREDHGAKYRNYSESIHHILATSIGWANIEQNKIELFDNLHIAHHRLYGNLPPDRQLQQRLRINGKVLTDEAIQWLKELLAKDDIYWYKNWVRVKKF